MHTDEAWLAGLSRTILQEKTPAATETFFNLMPRAPHAIKILFHFIQIIFIKFLGYSLFSIRLLSLFTGAACLYIFHNLLKRLKLPSMQGTVLLSVQIQFIYASHFGRQEIQILLLMLISVYIAVSETRSCFKSGLLTGLPIAIAVGFHPNAFIAAWPSGLLLLWGLIRRKRSASEAAGFLLLPAAASVLFVLLSLNFNSGFVTDYGSFGKEVGVLKSFDMKLLRFDDFYQKLFLRVSGTYYTPRIWPVFILSAISAIVLIVKRPAWRDEHRDKVSLIISGLAGVNLGILIIGKYSAPSVVFIFPFLILIIVNALNSFSTLLIRHLLFAVCTGVMVLNSAMMITQEIGNGHEKYSDFTRKIQSAVPQISTYEEAAENRILGPLTTEFCFKNGRLLDWRNLSFLRAADISLEDYVRQSKIKYIIYTGEYDLIYKQRPVWNLLYGNPTIYQQQLQDFINTGCELISRFTSPGYGTRIAMHRFTREWQVRIYRVK